MSNRKILVFLAIAYISGGLTCLYTHKEWEFYVSTLVTFFSLFGGFWLFYSVLSKFFNFDDDDKNDN
jgi:succinate-acetate transporter protein